MNAMTTTKPWIDVHALTSELSKIITGFVTGSLLIKGLTAVIFTRHSKIEHPSFILLSITRVSLTTNVYRYHYVSHNYRFLFLRTCMQYIVLHNSMCYDHNYKCFTKYE